MAILNATHLKKYYGSGESLVKALDDINVSVENGKFVAVIGTSGSGKSTLLNLLGGLDTPTSGSVQVEGKSLEKLTEDQLTVFRRQRIGFIFQNYNLIPYLTVYENIVLPVRLDGKTEDKKFLEEIVQFLELDGKLQNYPSCLSGGQQQRVAIARALVSKPAIILADEPTGNLDSRTSDKVIDLLKTTSGKFHQTIVMITHNPDIAEKADVRLRIEDGKIAGQMSGCLKEQEYDGETAGQMSGCLKEQEYGGETAGQMTACPKEQAFDGRIRKDKSRAGKIYA